MIVITGIIAIVKDRFRMYSILVFLEILLSFILLFHQNLAGDYDFTVGVLVNFVYCLWLLGTTFVKKPVSNATNSF